MPIRGDIYYYESKGKANGNPPIILLHGAGGTHLNWPHHLRKITDHKVYAPDLPGHGKSKGLGEQTIQGYGKAVIDWMLEIGVPRAIFLGHSMGGAIAQELAINYSEHVLGLGLICTGGCIPVNSDLLEKLSSERTLLGAFDLVIKWSYEIVPDKITTQKIKEAMMEIRPGVIYGDFLACDQFDVRVRLGEIKVPTVIVTGSADKMTPSRLSEFLADNIPGSHLHYVEGGGHMMIQEYPEVVAKHIGEFISTIKY